MQLPARARYAPRATCSGVAWNPSRSSGGASSRRLSAATSAIAAISATAVQASQGSARLIVSAVRCRTRAAAGGRAGPPASRRPAPGARRARPRRRALLGGQPLRDVGHAVRRGRAPVVGLPRAELADHVVGRQPEQSGDRRHARPSGRSRGTACTRAGGGGCRHVSPGFRPGASTPSALGRGGRRRIGHVERGESAAAISRR